MISIPSAVPYSQVPGHYRKTKTDSKAGRKKGYNHTVANLYVLDPRPSCLPTHLQYYTIAVGKLNAPKMANFMEVDVFVLVACPENSLVDSQVYSLLTLIDLYHTQQH